MGTALRLLAVREGGSVAQVELATRVGKRANRTYSQSAAKGWLQGVVPSDLDSQLALALELGVDPGWLYFYPHSKAPAPAGAELVLQADEGGEAQPGDIPLARDYEQGGKPAAKSTTPRKRRNRGDE